MRYLVAALLALSITACATPLPQKPAVIGMTPDEVRIQTNWGNPSAVNRTITARGESEQWVYRGAFGKSQYLYFTNGKLTAIQN